MREKPHQENKFLGFLIRFLYIIADDMVFKAIQPKLFKL